MEATPSNQALGISWAQTGQTHLQSTDFSMLIQNSTSNIQPSIYGMIVHTSLGTNSPQIAGQIFHATISYQHKSDIGKVILVQARRPKEGVADRHPLL